MAPNLNLIDGKVDYSTPGAGGYDIPNIVLNDPKNRKLKVLTIGAGFSSIMMARSIQKFCENVDLVIYDKNHDIGGTWLENRYPGAACDVPSAAYTYNWALYPDWPRFFSRSADIWAYLDKVCEAFGLRKYMTFNTLVTRAEWLEDEGKWKISLRQSAPDGSVREFEETCDLFLYASGILNDFKWPDLPGLKSFKGRVVHTARWPKDYQEEEWKNDRVAVIGSGASSIQTVPNMQPHVNHMDIFVRTGVWFVQFADSHSQNKIYTKEEQDNFRSNPKNMVAHSKDIENQINGMWGTFYHESEGQKLGQALFRERMKEFIKDERLLQGYTPKFQVGCRRVTPGDPYMLAIQEKNIDVHFTAVERITEEGVVGADGEERKCDTIICATGFDVTYRPRFPIIGRNGVSLNDKWAKVPESYLGLAVSDMPNMVMFIGPTWPVENGSVAGPLQYVVNYTVDVIHKMQNENIKSWVPKQEMSDLFNEHAQEWIKHTVWKDSCRSWYKNNDTGRVNAIWPGSSLHYIETISKPRYEDFEIKYYNKNPWAFLGMGYSLLDTVPGSDVSYYFKEENIDPVWAKAVGINLSGLEEAEAAESSADAATTAGAA